MRARFWKSRRVAPKYIYWSMAAGLIPFPWVDIAMIAAVQLKMMADLARHRGIAFASIRIRCIVAALAGGVLPGLLAGSLLGGVVKAIPYIGPIVGFIFVPLLSGAVTFGIGLLFSRHLESRSGRTEFDRDAT